MGDLREWYQQEFNFDFSIPKKKKKKVDYKLIILELQKGPLTFSQIQSLAGVSRAGVSQVITTLSLHYPLFEAARGIYKLYGDDDYGDGINRAVLREYGDEWE